MFESANTQDGNESMSKQFSSKRKTWKEEDAEFNLESGSPANPTNP